MPDKEHRHELGLQCILGQDAIDRSQDLTQIRPGAGECPQVSSCFRHQQSRSEAVSADIRDDHAQRTVRELQVVEVISRRGRGRKAGGSDIESRYRRWDRRKQSLLDITGNLQTGCPQMRLACG